MAPIREREFSVDSADPELSPDTQPVLIWRSRCFSGRVFAPLSNETNSVHLLLLVPELSHSKPGLLDGKP